MRTVMLTGTDISSSRLGFGLSGLHHLPRSKDRQGLLHSALDAGITYFDTAPFYGHGMAEEELGRFATTGRHRLVIATKFGIPPNPWLRRFPALMYMRLAANAALRRLTRKESFVIPNRYDFSCASAVSSLDQSLRAMRTDHVDVLYLHEPNMDRLGEPERLIDTLHRLRVAGKVRYFGIAGHVQDCISIRLRYPALSDLLQVDAAPGDSQLDQLNLAGIPFQSSFGHFRSRQTSLRDALLSAISTNRHGVILFSTRRVSRIDSMVRLLSSLERA